MACPVMGALLVVKGLKLRVKVPMSSRGIVSRRGPSAFLEQPEAARRTARAPAAPPVRT